MKSGVRHLFLRWMGNQIVTISKMHHRGAQIAYTSDQLQQCSWKGPRYAGVLPSKTCQISRFQTIPSQIYQTCCSYIMHTPSLYHARVTSSIQPSMVHRSVWRGLNTAHLYFVSTSKTKCAIEDQEGVAVVIDVVKNQVAAEESTIHLSTCLVRRL